MHLVLQWHGGQNVGAGKIDRLGKGIKAAMLIGAVYSVVALVVLYFSADYIALLFVDAGETAIIELTRRFIMASALFYIPLTGIQILYTGNGLFGICYISRCI
mgnify:CR=1 FL=1